MSFTCFTPFCKNGACSAKNTPKLQPTQFSLEEREQYFHQYGKHHLTFGGFAEGFRYFDIHGKGYIAYSVGLYGKNDAYVLGDPVCAEKDMCELLSAFLEMCPNAVFVQVSKEPVARILKEEHGYYISQFGVTTIIDLATWSTKGKKKVNIRNAVNTARKQGIEVREQKPSREEISKIAKTWLRTRTMTSELKFLVRPCEMVYDNGARHFFAYDKDDTPIGFCLFDPMFEDGKVIGYLSSVCRGHPDFNKGLCHVINTHAMDVFKKEGVKWFDLGLSPLVTNDTPGEDESKWAHSMTRFFYKRCQFIYNFEGLRFAKSRYCGKEVPYYACHKNKREYTRLVSMLRVIGVV